MKNKLNLQMRNVDAETSEFHKKKKIYRALYKIVKMTIKNINYLVYLFNIKILKVS